jgi:DNA polymerase III alpha subunit (gram-positive type)
VTVTGEVFGTEFRRVARKRQNSGIQRDRHTGSLRISKFIRGPEDAAYEKVRDGMYISAQGLVSFNRWLGDIAMEPTALMELPKPERLDGRRA